MIIFFTLLLLAAITGLRKAGVGKRDYMSVNMTNGIKGFFLGMVFLSHIWGYTDFCHPYLDGLYQRFIRARTGQCIVVMFLFYSGYGVMESVKRKGEAYIDAFPVQRILRVLLQFDCVIMLFWFYKYLTGARYGLKKMLLTFAGWDGIGNSNWYIFCILWLYTFTFISFKVFQKNHKKAVTGIMLLSMLYMMVMYKAGREYWWYDTALCYTGGMLFSLYRKEVESIVNESFASWAFFVLVFLAGNTVLYANRNENVIVYQLWVFCFVAAIVTFTMRYVVGTPFLCWMGEHLFELYILQRLPMMVLKPYLLLEEAGIMAKYVYVVSCFLATVIIAIVYRKTVGRLVDIIMSGWRKEGNNKG